MLKSIRSIILVIEIVIIKFVPYILILLNNKKNRRMNNNVNKMGILSFY